MTWQSKCVGPQKKNSLHEATIVEDNDDYYPAALEAPISDRMDDLCVPETL
jgi:hypothetical protein